MEPTIGEMLPRMIDALDWFRPGEGQEPTILAHLVPGDKACRLALVLGPNAGGKSLVRRILGGMYGNPARGFVGEKVEVIPLSMEGRSGGLNGIARSMVYGAEDDTSTGHNSCNTIRAAINTCRGRKTPHVIIMDEPDLGMSDETAAGAGQVLSEFCADLPEMTLGVIVTSHSRYMVAELLALNPHFLHVGVPADVAPATARAWVERPIVARRPDDVRDAGTARRKAACAIIARHEAAAKKEARGTGPSR